MKQARWHGHGDLAASFVLIFPVLLAYQIGVLFAGSVNGADVVTRALYASLGHRAYLVLHACIAVGFIAWLRGGRRWATLRTEIVIPTLLEAALYALTLGAAVALVLQGVFGLGITGGHVVNALGAGVHEELVFRLLWFGGLVAVAQRTELGTRYPRATWLVLLVASSVAFSAAHHAGPLGEPFTMHAFAFRCLAGAAFAAIFWYRSLAHAVYAHAFYDLLVYWRG